MNHRRRYVIRRNRNFILMLIAGCTILLPVFLLIFTAAIADLIAQALKRLVDALPSSPKWLKREVEEIQKLRLLAANEARDEREAKLNPVKDNTANTAEEQPTSDQIVDEGDPTPEQVVDTIVAILKTSHEVNPLVAEGKNKYNCLEGAISQLSRFKEEVGCGRLQIRFWEPSACSKGAVQRFKEYIVDVPPTLAYLKEILLRDGDVISANEEQSTQSNDDNKDKVIH